ncbi:MAG: hypothetical protein IKA22_11540 [Lentisphaeria bacterium]|nr:hypothetical protein [Lentisphaeria bacterium]
MTDFLGMHWTLALTIISIVLMIVDLFIFQGGVLTVFADVFFTFIILHFLPTDNWIWLMLWWVIIFALILVLHFFVYTKIVKQIIDKIIAPQKHKSLNDALIGKKGKICWVEERTYIHINDEHIPCVIQNASQVSRDADKKAEAISWNDSGELIVSIVD